MKMKSRKNFKFYERMFNSEVVEYNANEISYLMKGASLETLQANSSNNIVAEPHVTSPASCATANRSINAAEAKTKQLLEEATAAAAVKSSSVSKGRSKPEQTRNLSSCSNLKNTSRLFKDLCAETSSSCSSLIVAGIKKTATARTFSQHYDTLKSTNDFVCEKLQKALTTPEGKQVLRKVREKILQQQKLLKRDGSEGSCPTKETPLENIDKETCRDLILVDIHKKLRRLLYMKCKKREKQLDRKKRKCKKTKFKLVKKDKKFEADLCAGVNGSSLSSDSETSSAKASASTVAAPRAKSYKPTKLANQQHKSRGQNSSSWFFKNMCSSSNKGVNYPFDQLTIKTDVDVAASTKMTEPKCWQKTNAKTQTESKAASHSVADKLPWLISAEPTTVIQSLLTDILDKKKPQFSSKCEPSLYEPLNNASNQNLDSTVLWLSSNETDCESYIPRFKPLQEKLSAHSTANSKYSFSLTSDGKNNETRASIEDNDGVFSEMNRRLSELCGSSVRVDSRTFNDSESLKRPKSTSLIRKPTNKINFTGTETSRRFPRYRDTSLKFGKRGIVEHFDTNLQTSARRCYYSSPISSLNASQNANKSKPKLSSKDQTEPEEITDWKRIDLLLTRLKKHSPAKVSTVVSINDSVAAATPTTGATLMSAMATRLSNSLLTTPSLAPARPLAKNRVAADVMEDNEWLGQRIFTALREKLNFSLNSSAAVQQYTKIFNNPIKIHMNESLCKNFDGEKNQLDSLILQQANNKRIIRQQQKLKHQQFDPKLNCFRSAGTKDFKDEEVKTTKTDDWRSKIEYWDITTADLRRHTPSPIFNGLIEPYYAENYQKYSNRNPVDGTTFARHLGRTPEYENSVKTFENSEILSFSESASESIVTDRKQKLKVISNEDHPRNYYKIYRNYENLKKTVLKTLKNINANAVCKGMSTRSGQQKTAVTNYNFAATNKETKTCKTSASIKRRPHWKPINTYRPKSKQKVCSPAVTNYINDEDCQDSSCLVNNLFNNDVETKHLPEHKQQSGDGRSRPFPEHLEQYCCKLKELYCRKANEINDILKIYHHRSDTCDYHPEPSKPAIVNLELPVINSIQENMLNNTVENAYQLQDANCTNYNDIDQKCNGFYNQDQMTVQKKHRKSNLEDIRQKAQSRKSRKCKNKVDSWWVDLETKQEALCKTTPETSLEEEVHTSHKNKTKEKKRNACVQRQDESTSSCSDSKRSEQICEQLRSKLCEKDLPSEATSSTRTSLRVRKICEKYRKLEQEHANKKDESVGNSEAVVTSSVCNQECQTKTSNLEFVNACCQTSKEKTKEETNNLLQNSDHKKVSNRDEPRKSTEVILPNAKPQRRYVSTERETRSSPSHLGQGQNMLSCGSRGRRQSGGDSEDSCARYFSLAPVSKQKPEKVIDNCSPTASFCRSQVKSINACKGLERRGGDNCSEEQVLFEKLQKFSRNKSRHSTTVTSTSEHDSCQNKRTACSKLLAEWVNLDERQTRSQDRRLRLMNMDREEIATRFKDIENIVKAFRAKRDKSKKNFNCLKAICKNSVQPEICQKISIVKNDGACQKKCINELRVMCDDRQNAGFLVKQEYRAELPNSRRVSTKTTKKSDKVTLTDPQLSFIISGRVTKEKRKRPSWAVQKQNEAGKMSTELVHRWIERCLSRNITQNMKKDNYCNKENSYCGGGVCRNAFTVCNDRDWECQSKVVDRSTAMSGVENKPYNQREGCQNAYNRGSPICNRNTETRKKKLRSYRHRNKHCKRQMKCIADLRKQCNCAVNTDDVANGSQNHCSDRRPKMYVQNYDFMQKSFGPAGKKVSNFEKVWGCQRANYSISSLLSSPFPRQVRKNHSESDISNCNFDKVSEKKKCRSRSGGCQKESQETENWFNIGKYITGFKKFLGFNCSNDKACSDVSCNYAYDDDNGDGCSCSRRRERPVRCSNDFSEIDLFQPCSLKPVDELSCLNRRTNNHRWLPQQVSRRYLSDLQTSSTTCKARSSSCCDRNVSSNSRESALSCIHELIKKRRNVEKARQKDRTNWNVMAFEKNQRRLVC